MERWSKEVIAGFLAATAALAVFAWLATQVFWRQTIAFDGAVREGMHAWASPALTAFFRVVTRFGSEVVLVPLGAVVAWRLAAAGRKRAAIVFVIGGLGGEALETLLKLFFRRDRPEAMFGYVSPSTYSFPSGHAMISVTFYGMLAALLAPTLAAAGWRAAVWAGATIAAVLIGASRIYLGVHHPSDVVAGYAAAVVWVLSVRIGYRMWRQRATVSPGTGARDTRGRARIPNETPRNPSSPETPA